ncbi:hypothetical protein FSP39_021628 [Pinctada imbricata]|uniref:C-Jun-amino-terminal kinase-interacting protein 4 n=1 Tax=Pinctada imbricata TaxID=66713 RepID=A0AA89BXU5_PINIB|nr:hypothetical protein FSP39_021628 [Pinctada imbricata]
MAEINETVYVTPDEGHVMSEKVSSLATNIYKEFERMIKKYDEDVVKDLMPLVVGLLEGLDQSLSEKQETEVELELLRDDNEQLLTQYEREKQLRKAGDQKYLEMEDAVEGEKKSFQEKIESLESIVRMLELKAKNSNDHVSRLEEKEAELKKEYNKLHERYTELFRTHMDYMERTKILMGTDRIEVGNSPRTKGGFQLPNLRPVSVAYGQNFTVKSGSTPPSLSSFDDMMSPRSVADSNVSLKSELGDLESPASGKAPGNKKMAKTCDKEQITDNIDVKESATATKTTSKVEEASNSSEADSGINCADSTMSSQKSQDSVSESNDNDTDKSVNIVDKSTVSSNSSETDGKNESVSEKTENAPVVNKEYSSQNESGVIASHTQSTDRSEMQVETENSVIEKSPKREDTDIVTSTPESSRERHDSRLSIEDAEFEEDRIMGLDHTLAQIVATTPELQELEESMASQHSNSALRNSRRNNDSIFDELNVTDADVIGDVDFGADITDSENEDDNERRSTGMGKELENLILENTELLETKNALNIVKDDLIAKVDELSGETEMLREEITTLQTLKSKLNGRVKELEDEVKKLKEELEQKNKTAKEGEEEDDVPMAQRKRFTRVEMARVLMERNQYKERLMELQEAVRWTEMIRASREHPEINPQKQKKGSIWNFFSNLFNSSNNKPSNKKALPSATVKYNAPTTHMQPVGDPNKKSRTKLNLGEKAKAYDFLQDDLISEKAKKEREKERKEQYKQVRAHVKKDDGRLQAYGWSLPAKFQPSIKETPSKNHIPVPVPVYCRPLLEKQTGLKIWCAAGVTLTGGKTRDGGSVVGASVFYSLPPESEINPRVETKDEVEKLNQELKDHEKNISDGEKEELSSLVWILTSTTSHSMVSVIDANSPGKVLESFRVSSSPILCIASVAGALESDYPVDEEILKAESYPQYNPPPQGSENQGNVDNSGIGGISLVQCATGAHSKSHSPNLSPRRSRDLDSDDTTSLFMEDDEKLDTSVEHKDKYDTESIISERSYEAHFGASHEDTQPSVFKAKGSPVSSGTATPVKAAAHSLDRHKLEEQSELVKDGLNAIPTDNDLQFEEVEKMSSVLPTMWLGSQTGSLYVHSSVAQWRRCLHSVKLRDSILCIVHVKGRVLVALADGTIAIFHRSTDGQWDLQNYHLLDLGKPHHSIRCMTVIANKHVWCGYRNKIHVVEPKSMTIQKTFDAHPRRESQVRQLAWVGDGVWVSIRLDSTLRLYHAYTYQHLQDVDIEPYVSKMLGTGKLGFSFVRITAMLISCNRLWIGTGNGVVISVPLSESNKQTISTGPSGGRPGGIIRVYSDTKTDSVTPGSFTPYCTMAQAQLSFHGHRDAVKFFVSVPGLPRKSMSLGKSDTELNKINHEAVPAPSSNTKLVLSGGEGYVDFRIGDGDEDENLIEDEKKTSLSKGDRSHLIVWEVSNTE